MPRRRGWAIVGAMLASLELRAAAFASILALAACAGVQRDFQRAYTPGQPKEGAKLHAYQAASFAQAFSDAHAMSWDARLAAVERDALSMLAAVAKSDYRLELELVPHTARGDAAEYEYYDVNAVLVPRSGGGARFVLPTARRDDDHEEHACRDRHAGHAAKMLARERCRKGARS